MHAMHVNKWHAHHTIITNENLTMKITSGKLFHTTYSTSKQIHVYI